MVQPPTAFQELVVHTESVLFGGDLLTFNLLTVSVSYFNGSASYRENKGARGGADASSMAFRAGADAAL
ncbi:hypothetical protein KIN20_030141 [Parelaphostrongylus tenuis]|uniref:Uncharacterized protein n=1 Tax=Parelaphostrongylus tenuis TaxID=148309 RepID=A0AAD5WFX3_PARTN|nr:hypothetical protein KIN20_030141 [Parelaphostrongylus tenuis]